MSNKLERLNFFSCSCSLRLATAVLLVVPFASCSKPPRPPNTNEPPPVVTVTSTPSPVESESPSKVSRRNSNVSLASLNQPQPQNLTDNDPHDLHTGDRVSTDADGEAVVKIANCMDIYVFKSSQLIRSACSKSDSHNSNLTCAANGTSLFNNSCGSKIVIQTDSADISLEGTYLSVTYLPDKQLTLVSVFQGKVIVRPVVNFEARTLGEPVEVTEGNFMITVPDEQQATLAHIDVGASPRKATPLNQLHTLVGPLGLQPWLDQIAEQAKSDGVSISEPDNQVAGTVGQVRIDCDCQNVSAGLLTGPYQRQCKAAEDRLRIEFAKTGKVTGKCDSVASGPKATPRSE